MDEIDHARRFHGVDIHRLRSVADEDWRQDAELECLQSIGSGGGVLRDVVFNALDTYGERFKGVV